MRSKLFTTVPCHHIRWRDECTLSLLYWQLLAMTHQSTGPKHYAGKKRKLFYVVLPRTIEQLFVVVKCDRRVQLFQKPNKQTQRRI
jgi:hypothetical protein